MAQTKENITTIPLLPELTPENITGDEILYAIKGLGSDRDFCLKLKTLFDAMGFRVKTSAEDDNPQYLGQKLENIDGGVDAPRNGDVAFREEDTRGGKVMAAFIRDKVIKASMLADGFKVEKGQIGDQAVDTDQLAGASVGTAELKNGAVTAQKMGLVDLADEGVEGTHYYLKDREGKKGEIKVIYCSSGDMTVHWGKAARHNGHSGEIDPFDTTVVSDDMAIPFMCLGKDPVSTSESKFYIWSALGGY